MAKAEGDEIDIHINAENVSFLDNYFDNSFALQSSLNYIKQYVAQTDNEDSLSNKVSLLNKKKSYTSDTNQSCLNCSINNDKLSQLPDKSQIYKQKLSNWGLPNNITEKYEQKGIIEMFKWQVQCLGNSKVLLDSCNLIYSAPTSAGKTLVAEILCIKTILERQKKVIIILPFVSIVREKMFYLQDILSSSGIRVEGFMGSQSPPGGLQAVHLAICTIEKANSLVNKLIDEGNISELGAVIVDELHLLGDPHRGYILELLLTKIKYLSSRIEDINIQIIGMSATLPNLETLSSWLDAELFVTDFRPIPLEEYCLIEKKFYDKSGNYVTFKKSTEDLFEGDSVLNLCLETIKEGCSVLIFCMTKNRCESLAQSIASSFYKLGCSKTSNGIIIRDQLDSKKISETLEQLQNCPVGLDQVLKSIVSFGVAYHHAGLTFDERDIIEGAFKSGALRVLIATSTLSSGVNLPARKVIIRSPVFQRQPINILTYKQMVGRAGRMGKDTKGESILMCSQAEKKVGFELMMGNLDPVKSCIDSEDKFMRAILEMIAGQAVCTKYELELYSKCTLLYSQKEKSSEDKLLENTIKELINFELVRVQTDNDNTNYISTSLGKACLASSMAPNDGLSLFCELQKARQCLVLENDLHLIYLVTPYSVSNQWNNIDWLHLLTLWESLPAAMKRVGELVGVQESFIICSLRGVNKSSTSFNKLNIHKRFYTALALQDLVNEKPLSEVAHKFQCARGFLQGLQQSSATFAGMVTAFCHQLGWKNMEMLISQFQDRLHFGIHSDLLELMKLTSLNGVLGIYNGRKISTKKSVLTAHNSPMASIVIYWRKLNSILTKTLYPLTEQASIYSADNRISPAYTMFTSTGRISMHEPNLQNVPRTFSIPIKYLSANEIEPNDDLVEFNCRNIFKAAPGYIFVSADYCQLEMRILTHYSGDAVLTKIMCSNADVFKSIAATWSGVPEEEVDDDLRQKAKQLCYGILYGMGNRTLAQHLDVTEMEAAVFMDTFYSTYPSIRAFTHSVVEDCRKTGYVETLMRRRRYLQDIKSTIGSKRSSAERQAVNTTIQGSASDIAKAAMCAIDSRTFADKNPPRLVLQMHDELIYEVPEAEKHIFPRLLKEVMENTVHLNVPLPVKVRSGASWGALQEMKF